MTIMTTVSVKQDLDIDLSFFFKKKLLVEQAKEYYLHEISFRNNYISSIGACLDSLVESKILKCVLVSAIDDFDDFRKNSNASISSWLASLTEFPSLIDEHKIIIEKLNLELLNKDINTEISEFQRNILERRKSKENFYPYLEQKSILLDRLESKYQHLKRNNIFVLSISELTAFQVDSFRTLLSLEQEKFIMIKEIFNERKRWGRYVWDGSYNMIDGNGKEWSNYLDDIYIKIEVLSAFTDWIENRKIKVNFKESGELFYENKLLLKTEKGEQDYYFLLILYKNLGKVLLQEELYDSCIKEYNLAHKNNPKKKEMKKDTYTPVEFFSKIKDRLIDKARAEEDKKIIERIVHTQQTKSMENGCILERK